AERDVQTRARRFPLPPPAPESTRAGVAVRGTALIILAASAAIAMLWWAQAVFVPIFLSIFISHALEPVVSFLERRHVPRSFGVFIVLMGVLAGAGYSAYALGDPVSTFVDEMPSQAQK